MRTGVDEGASTPSTRTTAPEGVDSSETSMVAGSRSARIPITAATPVASATASGSATGRSLLATQAAARSTEFWLCGVVGTSFAFEDTTVVRAGDTAVVDARLSFTGSIGGEDWSATTYVTDVWTRADGAWRVVRRHASLPTGREGAMRA